MLSGKVQRGGKVMGSAEETNKIIAACNTGPLILAFQCDRVDLLKRYFSVLYISPSQLQEFKVHGVSDLVHKLIAKGFIVVATELTKEEKAHAEEIARRIAASPFSGDPNYCNHLPEAEMMVIAKRPELGCVRVLLDERAARAIAEEEGLKITGFPGVVGRAGLDRLLTKDNIRQLLNACRKQGTHYSNELIEHVAETYGR
jgi:predicted nucleic acid-binding protein